MNLFHGDNIPILKRFPSECFDAVVTDPPYGLSFMGKKWDYDVPSVELWREVLRVLKPGGHVLSFGGTRTYHRMVVNIEDAGFEIRDQVMWLYGSGFPKSHNVSKAIDRLHGTKGEEYIDEDFLRRNPDSGQSEKGIINKGHFDGELAAKRFKPGHDDAKTWDGWGSALKPANEPICLARKPLEKGLTVAENVLKWGCGAINVDGCRIGTQEKLSSGRHTTGDQQGPSGYKTTNRTKYEQSTQGRWPANLLLDETAAEMLDAQSGQFAGSIGRANRKSAGEYNTSNYKVGVVTETEIKNFGGASRFFYVAKASKRERNAGLEGMPEKESGIKNDSGRGFSESDPYKKITNQNHHPTVKPIKLMEYLVKLVTPPGGTVLDPFMGSGSTGVAAKNLGFNFTGIELSEEYFEIAKRRLENKKQLELHEAHRD